MRKYVFQFPVNLPGGRFAVVAAEVPRGSSDIYDKNGAIHRKFWTQQKLFKRKANADKFLNKTFQQQRSFNLSQELLERGLFSTN